MELPALDRVRSSAGYAGRLWPPAGEGNGCLLLLPLLQGPSRWVIDIGYIRTRSREA